MAGQRGMLPKVLVSLQQGEARFAPFLRSARRHRVSLIISL
jgi:hypothetical protein